MYDKNYMLISSIKYKIGRKNANNMQRIHTVPLSYIHQGELNFIPRRNTQDVYHRMSIAFGTILSRKVLTKMSSICNCL
jgi:hypothetical protein